MDERERVRPSGCGVRPGEPCRLCVPGATGPGDCGLVYLVMTDPDLRRQLARLFAESEGVVSPEHVGWIQG